MCILPHADEPGGQERLESYPVYQVHPYHRHEDVDDPDAGGGQDGGPEPGGLENGGGHAILTSGESLAGDQEYAFPLIWDASSDCHSVAGFGQSPLEALLHGRRPEHPTREMDGQFSQTL